jgi:pimeloyl-ACP methyl ester carboxylesterase
MSAVLRYVKEQTAVVDRSKIVLVARSINAFVAIRVAAEMQDELQLAGVVLVAPVFDVVAMLDNYIKERLKSLGSSDLVRVENCWRRSPGYSASRWENHANGWLNFFGQPLRLTLLADIIRRAPEKHRLEEFIRNVGLVSRECPVLVLSHPDDPITGSKEAIKALHDAVELGGIEYANYSHIEIQSSHKPQSDIGPQGYPYERKDESEAVVQAIRERLGVMNVPVTV